jgi:hypothetical protein
LDGQPSAPYAVMIEQVEFKDVRRKKKKIANEHLLWHDAMTYVSVDMENRVGNTPILGHGCICVIWKISIGINRNIF